MQKQVTDNTTKNAHAHAHVIDNIVHLDQSYCAILGVLQDNNISLSNRLADIIDRYAVIMAKSLPDLTDNEWLAICDCYAGVIGSISEIHMTPTDIFDAAFGLDHKWGIDSKLLAERIHDMSFAEQVAIAEFLDRFWNWKKLHHGAANWGEVIERIKQSMIDTGKQGMLVNASK